MLLNFFELLMIILYVLTRVAGTVAIVWLLCTKLKDTMATYFLIALALFLGLGFSIKYDNPNNLQLPPVEQKQP